MPHLLNMDCPDRVLARRIEQLSDHLELDRVRIRGWALAQAVLAASWALEDHGRDWEYWIVCAELLAAL
jgi:streptomycin 6-kinase